MAHLVPTSAITAAIYNRNPTEVEVPNHQGLKRDALTGNLVDPRAALLTPPNSISPILVPRHNNVLPGQESEMEGNQALTAEALDSLGDLDSAGAITPMMLAKHHLPEVLLNHGPLAIRHIMSYLTSTLPGFSRITSAKARRLIVAALEGRVDAGTGGDPNEIVFEKVGWGRWDARRRGNSEGTPPHSYSSSFGTHRDFSSTGSSGRNASSDEDHDMFEADKMSLDADDGGYQSSEPAPQDTMMDYDSGDETSEEDWESIGADALRARSLPASSLPKGAKKIYQPVGYMHAGSSMRGPPTFGNIGKSAPVTQPRPQPLLRASTITTTNNTTPRFSSPNHDPQERAAIEALISMGSM